MTSHFISLIFMNFKLARPQKKRIFDRFNLFLQSIWVHQFSSIFKVNTKIFNTTIIMRMITQHKELKIYWWYKLQSREPEFLSLLVPCIFPDDVSLTHGYFFIFYRKWLHLNLGQFCYLLSFLFELFQKIKFCSMPPMEFYTNYTQRPRTSQSVNNGNDSQRRSW